MTSPSTEHSVEFGGALNATVPRTGASVDDTAPPTEVVPPATILLKKAAGITSGSKRPNTEKVGKVTRKQLEDIAKAKEPDLTAADLDAAVRTIAGSARSMGLVSEI